MLRRSPGGDVTAGSGDCKSSSMSKPRRISTEKRKLKFSISAILSKDEEEEEDEQEAEEQEQEDNRKLSPDTRRGIGLT